MTSELTNDQMTKGRFLRQHKGRQLMRQIQTTLADVNGVVMLYTCTKATQYSHKHAGWFRIAANGDVFVQSGKAWNCINLCQIKFGKMVPKAL